MECVIYMGAEDVRRQALNVFRIEMLGGKVLLRQSGLNSPPHRSMPAGYPRPFRFLHFKRCCQRSFPGLGYKPFDNLLSGWVVHRPTSIPDYRSGFPESHRPRNQATATGGPGETP